MTEAASSNPPAPRETRLRIRDLIKGFHRKDGTYVRAVDGIDLDVESGEILVILGPSGCGKTTLLRCIAGLESPDAGEIVSSGKTIFSSEMSTSVPPNRRAMSMLFQSYALWPHLTVADNVAYPLKSAKVPKGEIATRVAEVLTRVECSELAGQHPSEISGGQQQRVALARALVPGNQVVLFDEPLSNVDAKVREKLRAELLRIQRRVGFTGIYVTHDQGEALKLADRIAVLKEGQVAQLGTPREIYFEPVSRYVANFVGLLNEVDGHVVTRTERGVVLKSELGEIEATKVPDDDGSSDSLIGAFRPEAVQLSTERLATGNTWQATIEHVLFSGAHIEYVLATAGQPFRVVTSNTAVALNEGDTVWAHVPPQHVFAFQAGLVEEVLG